MERKLFPVQKHYIQRSHPQYIFQARKEHPSKVCALEGWPNL